MQSASYYKREPDGQAARSVWSRSDCTQRWEASGASSGRRSLQRGDDSHPLEASRLGLADSGLLRANSSPPVFRGIFIGVRTGTAACVTCYRTLSVRRGVLWVFASHLIFHQTLPHLGPQPELHTHRLCAPAPRRHSAHSSHRQVPHCRLARGHRRWPQTSNPEAQKSSSRS